MVERTLSIIKPDAVSRHLIGEVIGRFEASGLRVVALRMCRLTPTDAADFYAAHKARPFFDSLVAFMSSGPVVALVIEGENAIAQNRLLMGATDPKQAAVGTLRADFGDSIEANTVHGSDSADAAAFEIAFFFAGRDLL